ncbi:MAG: DUF305 domain-containing protein [Patescibacteria group bacterium]
MNKYLPQIMLFCGIAFTLCFLAVAASFYYRGHVFGGYSNNMMDRGEGRGSRKDGQMMSRNGSGAMNMMSSAGHDMANMPMTSHTGMTMADMANMLKGKTGDDLDKAFLTGMIEHHQGALDMAAYLKTSKHAELQKMGEDIIKTQTAEIEQMKKWQKDWGYTK